MPGDSPGNPRWVDEALICKPQGLSLSFSCVSGRPCPLRYLFIHLHAVVFTSAWHVQHIPGPKCDPCLINISHTSKGVLLLKYPHFQVQSGQSSHTKSFSNCNLKPTAGTEMVTTIPSCSYIGSHLGGERGEERSGWGRGLFCQLIAKNCHCFYYFQEESNGLGMKRKNIAIEFKTLRVYLSLKSLQIHSLLIYH